jgi:cysteinyl-tRNA synthetase
VGSQKMSKSLFNFILADELLAERDPLVVRYALGAAHYRSSLDITSTTFDEAEAALDRIRTFLERAGRAITAESDEVEFVAAVPDAFAAALDDDLNVPQALAIVHERVRAGNTALDAGDRDEADAAFRDVTAMLGVLALDPADEQWQTGGSDAEASALDALVQTMIALRADARASKDWGAADRVRDALALAGIALEDTADGTQWGLADARAKRSGAGGAQPRQKEKFDG